MAILTPLFMKERGSRPLIFAQKGVNERSGRLRQAMPERYGSGSETGRRKDSGENFEAFLQRGQRLSVRGYLVRSQRYLERLQTMLSFWLELATTHVRGAWGNDLGWMFSGLQWHVEFMRMPDNSLVRNLRMFL